MVMGTLNQLLFPLFPQRHLSFPLHFSNQHQRLPPRVCASSTNKARVSKKKTRTNTDLCNEIREFVSLVGLPEGHVPSLKEFSLHGRQDLANIVRRRGYKLIRDHLANPLKPNIESDVDEDFTGKESKSSVSDFESTGQNEMVKVLSEDVPLSNEAPIIEEQSSSKLIDSDFISDDESCVTVESSSEFSLQEKMAEFIQNTEIETIEESGIDIVDESVHEDSKRLVESKNSTELESSSFNVEEIGQVLCTTNAVKILKGNTTLSSPQFMPSASEHGTLRNDNFLTRGQLSADYNDDLDVETREKENQVQVDRLKVMLYQKELELAQLRQQIEKEKLALSILQTRAEAEINEAQKLISVKDAEMHAAEDGLFGLEEVEVQYCGEGATVEVAGSFNGWHHRIKMDPEPSSSSEDPIELRRATVWKTVLWLYPGIYEIKFIVDDHWMIDPQRESASRGTIQNNILRVNK